ncbi:MAG: tetratricopeptide repeat protein [Clostridia bacterium]|nr:tetratricopeptide repeat protein [Clostridia bacterium]
MKKRICIFVLAVAMMLLAVLGMAEGTAASETTAITAVPETTAITAVPETTAITAVPEMTEITATPETTATAAATAPAATTADTQMLDTTYTLALNAINQEDYATARKYLNIAFAYCDKESNPIMYADLLLKQACIDVIEGDNRIALLALDAALTIDPELADAYLVATQIYVDESDYMNAAACLEKYIELSKDTSMYETLAQLYEATGDLDAAQEAYDKYVAAGGATSQEAGFQSGLYRMESGKYAEAIEAFTPYADDETYGAGAMYNIGVCQLNLNDFEAAVEAFSSCEEKGGTFNGLYYNRGICYMMMEDWADGSSDFARSIETETFVDDAKYNMGICDMQQEKYEAAVATFTELIGDGDASTSKAMISISTDAQNTDEDKPADSQEEKVVNDAVYYFRGVCNAALGNLEAALRDYTTCIERGYELSQSYYQRAQVYAAMGDTEKQTSDLENSLSAGK